MSTIFNLTLIIRVQKCLRNYDAVGWGGRKGIEPVKTPLVCCWWWSNWNYIKFTQFVLEYWSQCSSSINSDINILSL